MSEPAGKLPTGRFVFVLSAAVVERLRGWMGRDQTPAADPPALSDIDALIERLTAEDGPLGADLRRFVESLAGAEGVRRVVGPEVASAHRILKLEARAADAGWAPMHSALASWVMDSPDEAGSAWFAGLAALRERVERGEFVAVAHLWEERRVGPPAPVDVPPNPLSVHQGYLDAAPEGIDARHAWGQGLDGSGVGLVLIDYEYDLSHPDLPTERMAEIPGLAQTVPWPCKEHGTMALGVVLARDDATGVVGIAPATDPVWVGSYAQTSDYDTGLVTAIWRCVNDGLLSEGDVLLLEAQRMRSDGHYEPVEFAPAVRDAIAVAVGVGAVVVEPAGNGGLDLDTADPGFPDSGAILVASARRPTAAIPPNAGPHLQGHEPMRAGAASGCGSQPAGASDASNYGSRVDCYAWGECVHTTLSATVECGLYTGEFSGTSSASAIIAGAAILVQHMRVNGGQAPLASAEMRTILADPERSTHQVKVSDAHGVPIHIGVMPDLKAIVGTLAEPDPCTRAMRERLARCERRRWWWTRWLCRLIARIREALCRLVARL